MWDLFLNLAEGIVFLGHEGFMPLISTMSWMQGRQEHPDGLRALQESDAAALQDVVGRALTDDEQEALIRVHRAEAEHIARRTEDVQHAIFILKARDKRASGEPLQENEAECR
jgi:hypothetical protein